MRLAQASRYIVTFVKYYNAPKRISPGWHTRFISEEYNTVAHACRLLQNYIGFGFVRCDY